MQDNKDTEEKDPKILDHEEDEVEEVENRSKSVDVDLVHEVDPMSAASDPIGKKSVNDSDDGEELDYLEASIEPDVEKEVEEPQESAEPEIQEDIEEQSEAKPRRGRGSKGYRNADEFIMEGLPRRISRASQKLKNHLTGLIHINLTNSDDRYYIDGSIGELKVGMAVNKECDCTINISSNNLMKVISGGLNPQVAMLSEKIQIDGKLSLAIYFFNLLTPKGRS